MRIGENGRQALPMWHVRLESAQLHRTTVRWPFAPITADITALSFC
ncbi:MAG: hypothetical protein GF331_15280 [Chitinivibrionales bacterium]|nr:hypothetical protein [Chitinivibrionales bacterium]